MAYVASSGGTGLVSLQLKIQNPNQSNKEIINEWINCIECTVLEDKPYIISQESTVLEITIFHFNKIKALVLKS